MSIHVDAAATAKVTASTSVGRRGGRGVVAVLAQSLSGDEWRLAKVHRVLTGPRVLSGVARR